MARTALLRADHEAICGDVFSFAVVADVSLASASLRCTVKRRLPNGDADAIAVATSDDGDIELDGGDDTRAIVTFGADDTAEWPTGIELHVDVQAVTSNGSVRTLARGTARTHHRVTLTHAPAPTMSLPSGFESAQGNSFTALPFNSIASETWQWHYDSAEFVEQRLITIRDIAVRGDAGASNAFSFPSIEVVLAEASTNYQAANHVTTFANNILRSQVCRPAGPWSGPASNTWVSLGLTTHFEYDPSTGNDFIVQVRKCGAPSANFGNIDVVFGAGAVIGGNRYGHLSNCAALVENFRNNEAGSAVPVILITYV